MNEVTHVAESQEKTLFTCEQHFLTVCSGAFPWQKSFHKLPTRECKKMNFGVLP